MPTLDEATCVRGAVDSIGCRAGVEVIVADGGSTDATLEVAAEVADRVVRAPRGRAAQLNAGAAVAAGDVLLFLHADSRLPAGAVGAVRTAMRNPSTVGGSFALRVDSDRPSLRLISWAANLRSRLLRSPYGDQGLFARREEFVEIGGYRRLEIMEDADFVRRLRRRGKLAWLPEPVSTSDRRWHANGVLRTTLVHLGAAVMFRLAVPPRHIRSMHDALLAPRR